MFGKDTLAAQWNSSTPSELAKAVERRKESGLPLHDLVTANPTEEGFLFNQELLSEILGRAIVDAGVYRPDARGQDAARQAIARYHNSSQPSRLQVDPECIVLTPGTSLAYWYAFRLLCEPGDEILCPQPTYPLFDDIATLAGVRVRRYHLYSDHGHWVIDPMEVEFQITSRTRALVLVSPHNPTGSIASVEDLSAICEIARRKSLAVIFDEVFREFTHDDSYAVPRPSWFNPPLSLTLNGFSKMFSLPGMKASWIVAEGDSDLMRQFVNALEYTSDTFLPVSEITQHATAAILDRGSTETRRFAFEYRVRMRDAIEQVRGCCLKIESPLAGPYYLLRIGGEGGEKEQELVLNLLDQTGILLHPGSLYSLPTGYLVGTCVKRPPWPFQELAGFLKGS